MWHRYYLVSTVEEAVEKLARHQERARIIAGGTDLLIELERGLRDGVDVLIDISRVPGLEEIWSGDDGRVHLGPLVTHNDVVGSRQMRQQALPLVQACWEVGAPQIRNRATIAGNLITASPANDTITPLLALDGSVTLRSVRGERAVALADFYSGVRRTVMAPDELMVDIAFSPLDGHERGLFLKLGLRRVQAISVMNVTCVAALEEKHGELVAGRSRIALGAVAPIIVRARDAERYLNGKPLTDKVIAETARLAVGSASPIDDIRGPAAYRTQMVEVLVRRALVALRENNVAGWMPEEPVMLWGRAGRPSPRPLPASWEYGGDQQDSIVTTINGERHTLAAGYDKTLLRLLREDVGLIGTKEGCAEGECGACTVFLDGAAVMSCLVPAAQAHESHIVTVEGLAQNGELHPVQKAFAAEGAVQCGYCTPGLVMSAAKLVEERTRPSRWEAQQAIAGNLCRCTGYYKVLDAIEKSSAFGEEAV